MEKIKSYITKYNIENINMKSLTQKNIKSIVDLFENKKIDELNDGSNYLNCLIKYYECVEKNEELKLKTKIRLSKTDKQSMYELAKYYDQNQTEKRKYLVMAAKNKHGDALAELGKMMENEKKIPYAIRCYEKAVEFNSKLAIDSYLFGSICVNEL